jgi:hypothetical protein
MKVTLEIEAEHWTWTVMGSDSKILSCRTMIRDGACAKATRRGDVCDDLPRSLQALAEAIEDRDAMSISEVIENAEDLGL